MAGITDYAQLYLLNQTIKNTANQALYSKRLLEYTMAKDAGEDALKVLSARWEAEDKEAAEVSKTAIKIVVVVSIIFTILYCLYTFL